jgi:hypothetical protein
MIAQAGVHFARNTPCARRAAENAGWFSLTKN